MNAGKAISPVQCRAARAALGWTQGQLAEAIDMAERTILTFERTGKLSLAGQLAIRAVLERAGARFIEGGGEIGVVVPERPALEAA